MYLIYDTETTGLPKNWKAPLSDSDNWPRMVQISWQIHDIKGDLIEVKNFIIRPENYTIPYAVAKIHGITTERAQKQGVELDFVLQEFNKALQQTQFVIGHNISFDNNIIGAEFIRKDRETPLFEKAIIDTKDDGTTFCQLPGGRGGGFKYPKLVELHEKLFGHKFAEAHNAAADVEATARCFLEMIRREIISTNTLQITAHDLQEFQKHNPQIIQPIGLDTQPYSDNDLLVEMPTVLSSVLEEEEPQKEIVSADLKDSSFTHLHLHTQYSLLDGAAEISAVAKKAKRDNMPAVAITDHGNMFGVKLFHKTLKKEGVKPILGCEVYVAKRGRKRKETKEDKSGWHLIILAKNKIGYSNLTQLVSKAWLDGHYYKPRIDKELLEEYKEGLVVLSACLGGEVSQKIMNDSIEEAEKTITWFKKIFADDYYLEIQRHRSGDPELDNKIYKDQVFVNQNIIELAKKHNVKVIATNDVHFVEPEDAEAQERLLCIATGKYLSDTNRMKYSGQEWMKTQEEMKQLFADVPDAIINTQEIVDKIEDYELDRSPLMPEFEIPASFGSIEDYKIKFDEMALIKEFGEERYQMLGGYDKALRIKYESDFLTQITYEGAQKRWGEITDSIKERLDFELNVIKEMGFPGYFLIVWDFLEAAREMGVVVGPGRGSAAGSAVAYSIRITEIDPIKYDLLFERFLNPDRISMPDIDIDFDDDGRSKVLKWVVDKYGEKRVAHIITFGTMAAKSSIRDVGRVQQYPLSDTMNLQKLVPDKPGTSLKKAFDEVPELKSIKESEGEAAEVLRYAEVLEGSVRNIGTHACGIIIGKDDLEKHIPVCTPSKESELTYVTQYDGKHVEDIGLLKMDFLGLKTLSIIKEAVENIKLSKGIDIDIAKIPLEDKATYELYSKGETTGLFQFESDGMKKHLKDLKPTRFEDLIAMNALYRPGPMEYIPSFIKRKHGTEKIHYDVPMMKKYLEETYGITVYQEQVMLLSRHLAGFSRGQSDTLRKAMGKKIIEMMDKLKIEFIKGCKANPQFVKECEENQQNIDQTIEKIWSDWEAFAKYAFNKSHATCYSYISYQTAYLKAHYPAEFMAAVLSRNLNDITQVTFFMEECRHMGLTIASPDVNYSYHNFTVDKTGALRFGMQGIKGVGANAVQDIIKEREDNGAFTDVFDFFKRVNLTSVNKRSLEALAYAGAFDGFSEISREQFFVEISGRTFLEIISSFGKSFQEQDGQGGGLFGDEFAIAIKNPDLPEFNEWTTINKLGKEKEHIGVFLSSHPLENFKYELQYGPFTPLSEMSDLSKYEGKDLQICGFVTQIEESFDKKGNPLGYMTIEDYTASYKVRVSSRENYLDLKGYFTKDIVIYISGKVAKWSPKDKEPMFFFNVNSMDLMSHKKGNILKSITLTIHQEQLGDELLVQLQEIAEGFKVEVSDDEKEKGNQGVQLHFVIVDTEKNIQLPMSSKNTKLEINDRLINTLQNIPEIEFAIQ